MSKPNKNEKDQIKQDLEAVIEADSKNEDPSVLAFEIEQDENGIHLSMPFDGDIADVLGALQEVFKEPDSDVSYHENLMEYWLCGEIYHEKDVIWIDMPDIGEEEGVMLGFTANGDNFSEFFTPIDISGAKNVKVENFRRVPTSRERFEAEYYGRGIALYEMLTPAEEVWYLATKKAKEMDTSGYAVVCLGGNFYLPAEFMMNYHTGEIEELVTVFNVENCLARHHNCIGAVTADVGNVQLVTYVRYLNGRHFNWQKRLEQELSAYRRAGIDFDPYADPYDRLQISRGAYLSGDDDDDDEDSW